MTGHQPLIALRQRGLRPAHVTFYDEPGAAWHQRAESLPFPDVVLADDDVPERLDLRFVVGLPVLVQLRDVERLKRMVLACERAGAARVYGFTSRTLPNDQIEHDAAICTAGEDQSWRN